ncbi:MULTISPECIES: twin-arginine translocase subunit TatC [Heyndrickxia]|jgi:sec-independent protein translocase protein TatC|uniref:Sec-independent protein translocase protein TatC n=1 Tax=Heyndrickxia oleronia TaxID=38875 RepID=A0A8E2IB10_9BACI|nr:twin-arginine translocase subunit TatC [Heyndrickxia oleronia]NYV66431.1 twin-arginine translocase subunit TatC [Bacillus sp. Gen3]OJH18477.1 twin arginine-targeting protein translocase TatC [Bacillus obstructivus]MCI1590826.1 twin-arginine translocase subunit TatC [Heyndrickxia oleronia]MCI1612817.1 twin-arginine translocase subunit TatC [Heyndrickxia oleronia]MCI1744043.1 twin-arginine translocase subunit TatC [Heyndrickxia oleronia]
MEQANHQNDQEHVLVSHLTELRKRMIIVIVFFILSLILGFFVSSTILNFIKDQPSAVDIEWNVFGFGDGITIYLKCALIVSVLITLPVALYQTWKFVKPGLTEQEKKGTFIFIPISFFLFILGVVFSYFVLFPMMLQFLTKINQTIGATETYGINQYFKLMFGIIFPISIMFELPVIVIFLTKVGIVNPKFLRKIRKVAYMVLVVIAAAITPPDFVSEILVSIPLLLLFEISIICSSSIYKKKVRDS